MSEKTSKFRRSCTPQIAHTLVTVLAKGHQQLSSTFLPIMQA